MPREVPEIEWWDASILQGATLDGISADPEHLDMPVDWDDYKVGCVLCVCVCACVCVACACLSLDLDSVCVCVCVCV